MSEGHDLTEPAHLFDTPRGVAGLAGENLRERMLADYRAADSRGGADAAAVLSTVPERHGGWRAGPRLYRWAALPRAMPASAPEGDEGRRAERDRGGRDRRADHLPAGVGHGDPPARVCAHGASPMVAPAPEPDDDEGQQDVGGDQHDPAEGRADMLRQQQRGRRQRGQGAALPRQLGPLPGGRPHAERPESRRRTTTKAVRAASPSPRIIGIRVGGRSSSRRIAACTRDHRRTAADDSPPPATVRRIPSTCRAPGKASAGNSWTTATPPAIRASAVRNQARNVRSLARVKR